MLRHSQALLAALILLPAFNCPAAECRDPDCKSNTVDVRIDENEVLRRGDLNTLFSFNVNHYRFAVDLLQSDGNAADGVVEALQPFAGVFYRYPGGIVANSFWWDRATGDRAQRKPQATVDHSGAEPVMFGIEEYHRFLQQVDGQAWYVLNLLGWSDREPDFELPADEVTESNARLATYLGDVFVDDGPQYFQLGNELDRAEYQWTVDKYVERSRASIEVVQREFPDARFVAFLRDFDWTYKGKGDPRAGTKSRYREFIPAVLDGLPEVNDMSLHFYYDDPGVDRKVKRVGSRIRQIRSAIDVARKARGGTAPNVWITEHARGINKEIGKGMARAAVTSNLSAAISTADFLIALTQLPEVKGAFWHGLQGGPSQVFDATIEHKDLRPRPVYWGYRVLRSVILDETLLTKTGEQPGAQYGDGYDVRAAGFRSTDGTTVGLWVANRRNETVELRVRYAPMAGSGVTVRTFAMHGAEHADAETDDPEIDLDARPEEARFDGKGQVTLVVEPSSITAFELRRSEP
jgi:hypothetical protein